MAGSINKAIIIGNLGNDPEIRHTQDGRAVANLSVATNESWKDRSTGERRERTEWHRVAIFDEGLVRIVEQYLHKGSKVYLEGQIRTRKWQDKTGQDRYSTEIVLQRFNSQLQMLDSRRNEDDYGDGGRSGDDHGRRGDDQGRREGGRSSRPGAAAGYDDNFSDPSGDGDGSDEDPPF